MNKNSMDSFFSIPTFYSGKSVFITGASGFLGKILVEKLLRSCPDIKEIFLLMRPKKNLDIEERLRLLLTNTLFNTLRHEQPQCFDKLILVKGDIKSENLGLSAADTDTLIKKTSIIFHVAANVKFDSTLKDAVLNNVKVTRDICILGERMENLVALVHVSSIYTQVDKYVIEEKFYPLNIDWRKIIQVAETLDENLLEIFKLKYIGIMPNQYLFTKRIAEQVINDYSQSLPCIIFRPSIVTPTLNEPVKGWLDNFNGPIGLCLGVGTGLIKIICANPNIRNNYVPVDTVIKSLIVSAWKRGTRMIDERNDGLLVYNCVSNNATNVNFLTMVAMNIDIMMNFPLKNMIWVPSAIITKSLFLYRLLGMLLHVIPTLFIDGLLRLSGKQPRLLNMQRKIYISNIVLRHFMKNEWNMKNEKTVHLSKEVLDIDQQNFRYAADFNYVAYELFVNSVKGCKIYLLNENMDQIDVLKNRLKIYMIGLIKLVISGDFRKLWIQEIVIVLIGIFFLWIIYGIIT